MIQFRIRIINHQFPQLTYFHAEINIIESYFQFLGKSMDSLVNRFLYHHTGSCHSAVILGTDNPVAVARFARRLLYKTVAGYPSETDYHACVLDRSILIVQTRSDNPTSSLQQYPTSSSMQSSLMIDVSLFRSHSSSPLAYFSPKLLIAE